MVTHLLCVDPSVSSLRGWSCLFCYSYPSAPIVLWYWLWLHDVLGWHSRGAAVHSLQRSGAGAAAFTAAWWLGTWLCQFGIARGPKLLYLKGSGRDNNFCPFSSERLVKQNLPDEVCSFCNAAVVQDHCVFSWGTPLGRRCSATISNDSSATGKRSGHVLNPLLTVWARPKSVECVPHKENWVKGLHLLQLLLPWDFGSLPSGLLVFSVHVCENIGVL